jgi:hypothetical protein
VKLRHMVGGILAVVAAEAILWAVTGMVHGGACGDVGRPVCPSDDAWRAVALFAGLTALVLGAVLTWGVGLLFGCLIAGVTALALSVVGPADERVSSLVIGGCFIALPCLIVAPILVSMRFSRGRKAKVAAFKERALSSNGVVTDVAETGVVINDDPRVRITVEYLRFDGARAQTETIQLVSRRRIPKPGDYVAVWYEAEGDQVLTELDPVPGGLAEADRLPATGLVDELERLAALHAAGLLNDDEFARAKRRLLDQ